MLRDFFLRLSLNSKLIGMMLLLSLSLMFALIFLNYKAEQELFDEFERHVAELTKAIRVGVEEVTSTGVTDEKRLQNYLNKLNAKGVKEISIIGPSDKIISSSNPKNIGKWITQKKKELIFKAELGESVIGEESGKNIFNVILPVTTSDKHYGYIHLSINMEDFMSARKANIINRLLATSVVFGIGILLIYIFAKAYTKPIEDAVTAARMVAAGNLDYELKTDRKDEIGELAGSFNYMVDRLKEDRSLRERLRKAEHLSGIVQFSTSIAHEIKNPLNFINLSIGHIKEKYGPSEGAEKEKFESLIENIKKEIMRVSTFAESFLEYGKPLELKLKDTDIDRLIEEVIQLVSVQANQDNIKILKSLEPLPLVKADPDFIKTCLYNIFINAFQAMHSGGELSIKTTRSEDKYIIIIEDTGVGIPHDKQSRVFEPFFSTKSKGLGLGLALTKKIIEEHCGKIIFKSIQGKGTSVTISLPFERKV